MHFHGIIGEVAMINFVKLCVKLVAVDLVKSFFRRKF